MRGPVQVECARILCDSLSPCLLPSLPLPFPPSFPLHLSLCLSQYVENGEVVGPRQFVEMEHGLPSRARPLLSEEGGETGGASVVRSGVGGWSVLLPTTKSLEEYASLDVRASEGAGECGDVGWWQEARETVLKASLTKPQN